MRLSTSRLCTLHELTFFASKCNGLHPCNTCIKRNLKCDYTDGRGPAKLMSVHATSPTGLSNASDSVDTVAATSSREATLETSPRKAPKQGKSVRQAKRRSRGKAKRSPNVHEVCSVSEGDESSRQSTGSESDEEAEIIGHIRMLQDPMERLRKSNLILCDFMLKKCKEA